MGFSKLRTGSQLKAGVGNIENQQIRSLSDNPQLNTPGNLIAETDRAIIKSSVAVHDRTQLETVFDYPLLHRRHLTRGSLRYQVEAYIFFPRQMGITPGNYPKERFYGDLRPLIRLREPRLTYPQLIGANHSLARSPVKQITRYLQDVSDGKPTAPEQEVIDETRIFACSLAGYYLKRIDRRSRRLKKAAGDFIAQPTDHSRANLEAACHDCMDFLDRVHSITSTWRRLIEQAAQIFPDGKNAVYRELKLVDEYCTYRIRDGLTRLSKTLARLQRRGELPELDTLERTLAAHARFDHWYSVKKSYAWITRASDELTIERHVFRRGALKRRVWQVLYLDVRTRPLFAFQQQLGAMVAAGLAAFWAVSTEIMIRIKAASQPNSPFNSWSTGTMVIVIALILAYVLKDRIKELGRSYFKSSLLRSIPDNSERILYKRANGSNVAIGYISEYTNFIPAAKLPEAIKNIHGRFDPEGLEATDAAKEVIHYRKVIDLNANSLRNYVYPLRTVHDILRLNIEAFLSKLDDPLHGTEMLDTEGRLVEMKMPKVYHLDLILKYSQQNTKEKSVSPTFETIRLVVNKNGLSRLEHVEREA